MKRLLNLFGFVRSPKVGTVTSRIVPDKWNWSVIAEYVAQQGGRIHLTGASRARFHRDDRVLTFRRDHGGGVEILLEKTEAPPSRKTS